MLLIDNVSLLNVLIIILVSTDLCVYILNFDAYSYYTYNLLFKVVSSFKTIWGSSSKSLKDTISFYIDININIIGHYIFKLAKIIYLKGCNLLCHPIRYLKRFFKKR